MAKKKKKLKARGNFRQVVPAVAARLIKQWEKKGVTKSDQIPDGPQAGVQKIRLREALSVWRDYSRRMADYEKALAEHKTKLAEFNSLKAKNAFDKAGLPIKYVRPKAPTKPSMTGRGTPRSGNFKRVSKKQAKSYLARLFNFGTGAKQGNALDLDTIKPDKVAGRNIVQGPNARVSRVGRFTPRIQEAMTLLGPEEATTLFVKGQKNRAKRAEKAAKKAEIAEKRKKTVNAKKVAAAEKAVASAQKRLTKAQEAAAAIVSARRARRSRRASRKLRRRARRSR